MESILTGAVFGAALTSSGVYQPSVIVSQMAFSNWHMIQVFLTAAATSAIVVTAAQRAGYASFPPRKPASLGLFGRYDGNVIGGLLLGAGMALSGACPGTVLAQVGLGVQSGLFALAGGVGASIVWSGYHKDAGAPGCEVAASSAGRDKDGEDDATLTLHGRLGVSQTTVLGAFVAMCAAAVTATFSMALGPETRTATLLSGVSLGLVQLVSIFSRDRLLGVSGSYEEMGRWAMWLIRGGSARTPKPLQSRSLIFAAGIVGGSWLLLQLAPHLITQTHLDISTAAAFLGGAAMILGSTIAGGCTSGHGISGVSLFSMSSFVTLCAIFAGGAAVALPSR